MAKYRVTQNFGRWGRAFKIGETVDVEKELAAEVPKALRAAAEPERPEPPEREERGKGKKK